MPRDQMELHVTIIMGDVVASHSLLVTSVTNVLIVSMGFQIVKVSGSYFQYFILFLIKQIIFRLQLSKPRIKKFDM